MQCKVLVASKCRSSVCLSLSPPVAVFPIRNKDTMNKTNREVFRLIAKCSFFLTRFKILTSEPALIILTRLELKPGSIVYFKINDLLNFLFRNLALLILKAHSCMCSFVKKFEMSDSIFRLVMHALRAIFLFISI